MIEMARNALREVTKAFVGACWTIDAPPPSQKAAAVASSSMKVGTWLRKLLPILAIVGLIAGPFTAPVSGVAMAAASAMSMSEMADEMPCCPQETPAVPDCQKTCQLMATCMAQCLLIAPMLSSTGLIFGAKGDVFRPGSDVMGDTLAIEPPARPPRT